MKILTAEQIRQADEYTIKNEPVASIDLMERAASAFTEWFTSKFSKTNHTVIICGPGNNGGDGLAVARLLLQKNYKVKTYAVKPKKEPTEDFRINEKRLNKIHSIRYISDNQIPSIDDADIIIDALFGSGLARPVEDGIYKEIISKINSSAAVKVAIDIPSGLFADKSSGEGAIVKADFTISFQTAKLAFLLPENHPFTGEWKIVDIGLHNGFIKTLPSDYFILQEKDVTSLLRKRSSFSHKGDFGKLLLISGSYGKIGAAVLAAKAALRSGVGLLTVHAPRCGYSVLQMAASEAMISPDEDEKHFSSVPDVEHYDAIGVGPGIGTDEITLSAFAKLLSEWKAPMVIDADGLNLLAKNHHLLDMVPKNSILTPHPKEFERIAGETSDDFNRISKLKEYATEHQFFVVLKGYNTAIATPEGKIFFNQTGNPGMATGGTGDVLTGIISAFLAQNYNPEEAAKLAVWLHGLSGDLGAAEKGYESLIASDVIEYIPAAFRHLHNRNKKKSNY